MVETEEVGEVARRSSTAWVPLEMVREPIITWYLEDAERAWAVQKPIPELPPVLFLSCQFVLRKWSMEGSRAGNLPVMRTTVLSVAILFCSFFSDTFYLEEMY